jgi:hypothetical protein
MVKTDMLGVESLREAHVALLDGLERLKGAAGEEGIARLLAILGETRTQVAEHFRFEEQGGCMGALAKREPRLDRPVEHLIEEHGELLRSLETLTQEAAAVARLEGALRERVRELVGKIRGHEARENLLVQDAYNVDLGAED